MRSLFCYAVVKLVSFLHLFYLFVAPTYSTMQTVIKKSRRRRKGPVNTMTFTTRRERRAERHRRLVTTREARLAARLARLDYKVSGETGAMRVPTKTRTWYRGNRKTAHAPPPGQGWDRSGRARLVEAGRPARPPKALIDHPPRRTANGSIADSIIE